MKDLINKALKEDYAGYDVTSLVVVPLKAKCRARIMAKQAGIIAGLGVAGQVFRIFDTKIAFQALAKDGQKVKPGQVVVEISGPAQSILACERTALNFLQKLSGIATLTYSLVKKVKPYGVKILDTRKTTPGWRTLEKYAVKMGGGNNHRFDLAGEILIKDNHIKLAGGIKPALAKVALLLKTSHGPGLTLLKKLLDFAKIEVEVENLAQLKTAAAYKVGIIMLDNFKLGPLEQAIKYIRQNSARSVIEVSGVGLANLVKVAKLRPDRISLGALTHSAPPLDLSLKII